MYPLSIDHLLWRMRHVHRHSRVVDIAGPHDRRTDRSFPEIATRAENLSAGLCSAVGIGAGDVVGVLAFNTGAHLEALFAIPRLGAAVNSLNVRLSADALTEQALSPKPAAVLVDTEMIDHSALGDNATTLLKQIRENAFRLSVSATATGRRSPIPT
ncbi:AMP-binding protein [Nocardia coffeae]|uniref:AMP-binding protein n=1 Tax=Nocardia coffeae TaxID=2873381 RepID=UPI0022A7F8BF|nr:AMP-binding protein [Nocardia coffeae]